MVPNSTYSPRDDTEENPGPGSYRRDLRRHPQYTFGRAKSAASIGIGKLNDNPGVGRYGVEGSDRKKGNAFGRGSRTNFISKNTAGVGDYEIAPKKGSGCTMGRAGRFKKEKEGPGPGDYNLNSILAWKSKRL